ncbi:MAG: methyltransferase domain-containing protein [Clostridiales bacterium]|nr:methyltransferase domain-containing protein [Clostridiales bacterium]
MRAKAEAKGITVYDAAIEDLPFEDGAYYFALTVTLDCFLEDIGVAFRELNRILRPNGRSAKIRKR